MIRLDIDATNAAYDADPAKATAAMLRAVADRIEATGWIGMENGAIPDGDGRVAGYWAHIHGQPVPYWVAK